MESASASGAIVPPVSGPELDPMEILTAATALRWSRPDLTAALAEHVMEAASALSDRDPWLLAAGWRVLAAGAVGDGREAAADVLEALPRWGADALLRGSADRLRVELAVLAHDAGEPVAARGLLDGLSGDGRPGDAELAADLATARLRCRGDVAQADPADALTAWERLGGAAGQVGAAAALLVAAVTDRRTDRAERAVARAVDGLGRLDRARPSPDALSPSPHLAAALAAEWISSLIATGRPDQAREGSRPLRERLVEHARPTRQLALLRLTLARAAADDAPGRGADAVRDLERAAHDAAVSDAPELERICRTALGEVHEAGGRPDAARESVRLAVVAERRHRSRGVRFLAALAAGLGASAPGGGVRASSTDPEAHGRTGHGTSGAPTRSERPDAASRRGAARDQAGGGRAGAGSASMADRTAILRAVQAASMADAGSVDAPAPDTAERGGADRSGADRGGADRGSAARGPADAAGGSRHRSGDRTGAPDAAGWTSPSWVADGSTGVRSARPGHAANGAGSHGAGSLGATANGSGAHASAGSGSDANEPDSNASGSNGSHWRGSDWSGSGQDGSGVSGSRVGGSDAVGSGSNGSGSNGSRAGGSGTNGVASWADHFAGNGKRRRGVDDASGGPADSSTSGRGDVDAKRNGDERPGVNGFGSHGEGAGASGPDRSGTDARSDGARPRGVPALDPWATGAWTPTPPPVADAAPSAAVGGQPMPPAPDPVLSALADPEAWLASALADLDRIWGRQPDESDGTVRDEDAAEPPEADESPAGCVVVLDLARGGERLPADDAASTVRRVARRLAQRLPESAHLRRDSPDALSVLLAGDDRAAAAEWMHHVVPALVDGLAVDAAVEGAHLRAAVHDAQGVVGAQVLQRLDGVRSRPPHGGTPGRARHAAPGSATPDEGASDDPTPGVSAVGPAPGAAGGSATGRAARRVEARADSGAQPAAGSDTANGWATNGWTATAHDPTARDATARGATAHDAAAQDATTSPDATRRDGTARDAAARDAAAQGVTGLGVTAWDATAWDATGRSATDGGTTARDTTGRSATDGDATAWDAPGRSATDREAVDRDAAAHQATAGYTALEGEPGRSDYGRGPLDGAPATVDGVGRDIPASGPGRHDEVGGRRPYLPDGVVVRPGSGGRRHRPNPDPVPEEPAKDAAPVGPQSTEGLGLADLLAGALAAYRGI